MNMNHLETLRHEHCDKFWERFELARNIDLECAKAGLNFDDYHSLDPFSDLISDLKFQLNLVKRYQKLPYHER